MSEVFDGYERQYCEISASLSRKCTSAAHLDGEKKKQKVSEIKAGLDDAENLIRKMDLEARSLQPSVKAGLLAKLREYKSDLNNLKSELKRITTPNPTQASREELLESGKADNLLLLRVRALYPFSSPSLSPWFRFHRRPRPSLARTITMSEVFDGYERQYCEISASLSRKCTSAAHLDGEKKKQKVSEIKAGLDDAENLIRKMDLEARSLQPSVKAGLLAKLREYKSDLNNLKSELKRITTPNPTQASREELLESGKADMIAVSADQRGRLLMSTERLNQSTDRIKEGRRTMLETEELGVSILQDLHQQRQSLLHAHNTLHGVDDNISKSRKILTAMSRRMDRNKWIIGGIMVALVLAILVILYFKLTH